MPYVTIDNHIWTTSIPALESSRSMNREQQSKMNDQGNPAKGRYSMLLTERERRDRIGSCEGIQNENIFGRLAARRRRRSSARRDDWRDAVAAAAVQRSASHRFHRNRRHEAPTPRGSP
eukprot:6186565-Pleurochrysis_carterae.AAC.1